MPETKTTRWKPFLLTAESCVWTSEGCPDGEVVLIDSDVFAEWEPQPPVCIDCGESNTASIGACVCPDCAGDMREMTAVAVWRDLFAIIDDRQNQRFILPTRYPKRVRDVAWEFCSPWPQEMMEYEDRGHIEVEPAIRERMEPKPLLNLTLAVPVDGAAGLVKLPKFTKLRDLCGGLGIVYSGKRLIYDSDWMRWLDQWIDTLILDPAELTPGDNIASARRAAESFGVEILETKGEK